MEARVADELPRDEGWQFEPKWDDFRCLAFREGKTVDLGANWASHWVAIFPRW